MSFDLSSLLKNEIAKKQQNLNIPAREVEPVEAPQASDEEKVTEEVVESNAEAIDENPLNEQLERLNNRPARVEQIISEDSKISIKIDPTSIGDEQKVQSLSRQCNLYIHEILAQWDENQPEYHPELHTETKKSLFPLLVKLRRGTLAPDLVISLATVLYHLQQPNENNLAIESYMKLSIGNVAWPIGVTSVGIHARSAHSKIQGENGPIANIMLDDQTRLWITSIKRLITFQDWLAST